MIFWIVYFLVRIQLLVLTRRRPPCPANRRARGARGWLVDVPTINVIANLFPVVDSLVRVASHQGPGSSTGVWSLVAKVGAINNRAGE